MRRDAARLWRGQAVFAVLVVAALLAVPASLAGQAGGRRAAEPRVPGVVANGSSVSVDVRAGVRAAFPPGRVRAAADLRTTLGRFGRVDLDRMSGTPRLVARLDGYLTPASGKPAEAVALDYVRAHPELFGLTQAEVASLELMRSWRTDEYSHLVFAQTVGGIPAVDSGIVANVTADGRLINIGGSPLPGLQPDSLEPGLSAAAAVDAALDDLGATVPVAGSGREGGPRQRTTFAGGQTAKLVIFGDPAGSRLAWRVTVHLPSGAGFDTVVDAANGRVLRRRSLTSGAVTASVFPNFPGAAVGGAQATVDISRYVSQPGNPALFGDFAYVFTDVNDDGFIASSEAIPPSSGDDYLFTFHPFAVAGGNCSPFPCSWDYHTANSWTTNRKQAATQAFYLANRFHDHLLAAPIGFTAAKGNFEGTARVWVDAEAAAKVAAGLPDADDINNSFMSTYPPTDVPAAVMTLELFQPVAGAAWLSGDSADEISLVYHEYTHGMSARLSADGDWVAQLHGLQADSINEASSDWYALDYIVSQGFITDTATSGEVKMGAYVDRGTNILRSQALDCAKGAAAAPCPGSSTAGSGGYTYGDMGKIDDGPEPHADGEIWAETLWDLRRRLIADHGTGEGVRRAELLATRGLELAPADPTFLDMRNAILQADTVFNAGADRAAIWQVFAARGMGYFASSIDSADAHPVENFSLPPSGSPGTLAGVVTTEAGTTVASARVEVGGHNSGFGDDLTATTNASGQYSIPSVPAGTYKQVLASAPGGYDVAVAANVPVTAGATTTRNFSLVRDWASSQGGAAISAFTGPDYSPDCGPSLAIDGSAFNAWVTDSPARPDDPGPKSITVKLPAAVNVSAFGINPTTGCNEGITTSLGDFKVETSTDGVSFVTAASGTFTSADDYRLNKIVPGSGTGGGVRYVRLTGVTTQNMNPPFRGSVWMSVTEFEVYGSQPCARAGNAMTISTAPGGAYMIARSGASFVVSGPGISDTSCGGATVNNIDKVTVNGTGGGETVTIDESGGRFEPGASAEATGASEIEFSLNLGAGSDRLVLNATAAADTIRLGTLGANLNADDDGNDVILGGVELLTANGSGGDDQISLQGALGSGSPLALAASLNGGAGNDQLTGGTKNDTLNGDADNDTCIALTTPDGADVCKGGSGVDTAAYATRSTPLSLTNDGAANDGAAGEGDNIGTDVENLTGGQAADTITTPRTGANIASGGAGNDTLDVRDGIGPNGDKADGGGGTDTCLADTGDTRLACEN
jgi:hypothetical protein